jgi:hypothetical protein
MLMKTGLAWKATLNRISLSANPIWARLRSMPKRNGVRHRAKRL